MDTDEIIIKRLFKTLVFTPEELKLIKSLFIKVSVSKGDILMSPGDHVESQFYIIEGCLRTFHIDSHGKEYTVQFGIDDWWMSDYTAFFRGGRAIMTVEALQDSKLYMISRENKDYLYEQIPEIDKFFRIKLERAFGAFQRRILNSLSMSAAERYTDFMKSYPVLAKCLKNYHIASYLGITTESLSRIRKELVHN